MNDGAPGLSCRPDGTWHVRLSTGVSAWDMVLASQFHLKNTSSLKENTSMFSRLKIWARRLSRDGHAIYLASRDPRVPWYAKFLAIAVAGYALSPIDLIPDFIPVLGYLDDLIIVPLGIWLVVSLMPEGIMVESFDKDPKGLTDRDTPCSQENSPPPAMAASMSSLHVARVSVRD